MSGGGIIANSEIIHGVNGPGGEIGHITSVVEGGHAVIAGKQDVLKP